MNPNRFQVFKQSIDGNQIKWGYKTGLTFDQARDLDVYPAGIQTDVDGTKFTWGYSVTGLN